MASATSKVSKVETGTSVRNRESNFYKTEVTTLADGSAKTETFRTDKDGNNSVKIRESTTDKDGKTTTETTSNATQEEKRALQNPDSQLSQSVKQQVESTSGSLEGQDGVTKETLEKASGADGNSAKTEEEGDSQASEATNDRSNNKNFGTDLRYPADIASDQDVIQFTALKYEVKAIEGFSFGGRERVSAGSKGSRSLGTVTLPIQSGIKDSNIAGWGEDEMDPLKLSAANTALKTITQGIPGFDKSITQLSNQLKGSKADFKTFAASTFAEKAAGVQNLLSRTQGKVLNPNLELLFQKPALRPFTFQFKLSARSKEEADKIIKIIRFFKQNMAPQKGGGSGGAGANLFLLAPNTFQVHYLYRGGDEHPYIGKMKECAITGFEVDYTPDGNYSTLKDGYMTSYAISITMKELEPIFYEDYDDIPDTELGF